MHPVFYRLLPVTAHRLGNLRLVVGEHQVHPSSVDIKLGSKVFGAHCGTFQVPAGEAGTPGRRPAHYMLGLGLLPEGKIHRVALFILPVQFTGIGNHILQYPPAQLPVIARFIVLADIKIHGSIHLICQAGFQNGLDHLYLFNDMSGSPWFDRGTEDIHLRHIEVVAFGIMLYHFHRFNLLQSGFLCNLVFPLIGIIFQVSYIGDVADVANLISQMPEIAKYQVESDGRAGVPQMGISIYCGSADI